MKKIMIFAAMTAMFSLVSCQKEEVVANNEVKGNPVFTASISQGTKTTVDVSNGKLSWETDDKITVTDASSKTAVYKIGSIDGTTGKATFVYESGQILDNPGSYTATYGNAPSIYQTYSATAGKLYMTASTAAASENDLVFTVQCGLMKLNLTKSGETITNIAVTGTPTGGTETTYTLYCSSGEDISSGKDFYIALPAGNYYKIEVYKHDATNGFMVCNLTASKSIEIADNRIKPVDITISKTFTPCEYLPGMFSVSDTKQVHFSKGNLYYNGASWGFETKQYYFRTYGNKGKCDENGYNSTSGTPTGHWGLFGWVGKSSTKLASSTKKYGVSTSEAYSDYGKQDSDVLKADWGTAIDDSGTWRTLTSAEWTYLFNTRPDAASKVGYATVGGVNGIIILPDNFTDPMKNNDNGAFVPKSSTGWTQNVYTSGDNWNAMESAGAVFLPAAGRRTGSNVSNVGDSGYYWSSTAHGSNNANCVDFNGNAVLTDPDGYSLRNYGCSVRLITECQ